MPFASVGRVGSVRGNAWSRGLAEGIGWAILGARERGDDPIAAAMDVVGGFRLFAGKVTDVERRTSAVFARGKMTIAGLARDAGSELVVEFQNENLIATRDDVVLASVPDLITIVDADSGEPVTTEELKYGLRVEVVGIPCHQMWRTPEGLELLGPKYFGYDVEFVPIEELAEAK